MSLRQAYRSNIKRWPMQIFTWKKIRGRVGRAGFHGIPIYRAGNNLAPSGHDHLTEEILCGHFWGYLSSTTGVVRTGESMF